MKDANDAYLAGEDIRAQADALDTGDPDEGWRNSSNGAAADPFLIPDEFRDREHHRCWVEALIAAVTPQTAEKAKAAWNGAGPQILKVEADAEIEKLRQEAHRIITQALQEKKTADPHEQARAEQEKPAPPKFAVVFIDDIEVDSEPVWLIKDLLPATGIGVVFGLPKTNKGFILSDALFHVAMGRSWAGRDVLQGAALYVSSEGRRGLKRRFVAMRRNYGVEGKRVPFGYIPVMPDLGHSEGDAEELICDIRRTLASIGNPPLRVIALDTLARTMKGADENSAKDMGVLVANAEKIAEAFGCLVILVHHAGRGADNRSRGSNALDGGADVMWHVEKGEAQSRVSITAMKDGEAGLEWTFRLKQHWLDCEAAQQGAASTCTVEILSEPGSTLQGAAGRSKKPPPPSQRMLLDVLKGAAGEAGEFVKGDVNVPSSVRAVTREMLKTYARSKGYFIEGKTSNQHRADLSRDLKWLKVNGFIGLTDRYVWPLQEGG